MDNRPLLRWPAVFGRFRSAERAKELTAGNEGHVQSLASVDRERWGPGAPGGQTGSAARVDGDAVAVDVSP